MGKEETPQRLAQIQQLKQLEEQTRVLAAELQGYDENSAEYIEQLVEQTKVITIQLRDPPVDYLIYCVRWQLQQSNAGLTI